MSRSGRRSVTVAMSLLAIAALLTACSGSSKEGGEPSQSATSRPSTTVAPTDGAMARAKVAVLETYNGYWAAQIEAQAHPDRRVPKELGYYSIDKAQADIQATVLIFREEGIRLKGKPELAPMISGISLGDEASAAITDCVDSTHWKPVYTGTGKSALAPGQRPRVVMESTAVMYDGHWVIRTSVAHRDRTC